MKNAIALGTFDGLHKGHLSVLSIPDGYNKIALIFKIPPKCVKSGITELLLTPKEKEKRLKALGFTVKALNFSEVEHLSAEDFLKGIKKELNPALISCGFNYRFGEKGLGDTEMLNAFCKENGIKLQICDPVKKGERPISSSRIREHIKNGEIAEANCLLGEDFSFSAPIIHGDGRGTGLGFPTINQSYPEMLCSPKFGVYKTEIAIGNKIYKGITNIGNRPTFPLDYIISETFIADFSGDLYGRELKVMLKEFLRGERKFSSPEDLKKQVLDDIDKIKE